MKFKIVLIFLVALFFGKSLFSQVMIGDSYDVDYLTPKEYEIGGITISGVDRLDHEVIILLTGLKVGDKITIPGDKISSVIDKLWKQQIFKNVKVSISKIQGNVAFLDIYLEEQPRLSKFRFDGIKKSEANKLRETLNLSSGDVVTENLILNATNKIKNYYDDKGYFNTEINVSQEVDSTSHRGDVILFFDIKKNEKMKIEEIAFDGNEALSDKKLKKSMKETKQRSFWRFWKSSKFIESNFESDLDLIIEKYNQEGYRNAKIVADTIYSNEKNRLVIRVKVFEGDKFYFRNITWVGNTIYPSDELSRRLRIQKGDTYNKAQLEQNLTYDPSGLDITSMYMDNGYLFFNAIPVEVLVENDSIDIEIRIREGKQARIRNISVSGNSTTNDHVILREIRTLPGQLFSRDDVMRTLNALRTLGYFNQETVNPNIMPNQQDETVDIEYQVEEASTSRIELSGGWGGGMVIGSVGLSFTNFSMKNIFKKGAWTPLPAGDGQQLSLNFSTNGEYYYSLSASFTEPWLGGRKPNALSVSGYYSFQNSSLWYSKNDPNYYELKIIGASVSLGRRLKWPDDYFTVVNGISFKRYNVVDSTGGKRFNVATGISNSLAYNFMLGRNSLDALIYPRTGSDISFSASATLPYSLMGRNITDDNRYNWLEYYKINFKASWMFNVVDNLVFNTRFRMGFLGYYNSDIGLTPYERFYLGGDGLSGWDLDGREIIGMRGYDSYALSPEGGAAVYDKFTVELRYPISLNPAATIYVLGFAEAGYSWSKISEFNPFESAVTAGFGVRFYMPYFGTLGLDWGYGFHNPIGSSKKSGGKLQFSINQSID
ncbi:outer membrane protein assembly factor BamA [Bacteroidales bacterium OttesenSCG-928-C19]|nr:outer membrane protein assembly factor BamA [Bacteroidales bacterium OttesenSCG-928-C19]